MTDQVRPADLERRARLMKRVNVPMRFVLGLPFKTPVEQQPDAGIATRDARPVGATASR